jgi:hypothetical protein
MEAEVAGSSATSVPIHQTTRCHIPEDAILDKEIHHGTKLFHIL